MWRRPRASETQLELEELGLAVGPVPAGTGRGWATRGKAVRRPGGGEGETGEKQGRPRIVSLSEWREVGGALGRTVAEPPTRGSLH